MSGRRVVRLMLRICVVLLAVALVVPIVALAGPGGSAQGDPQAVAETIHRAVHDEKPKLRYVVGLDAEAVSAMRRQLDDDAFERAMRQALDFWD